MKTKLFTTLLMLLIAGISFAQPPNLEKAWESFKQNDITLAKSQFMAAANDPGSEAEANFMLSLIAFINQSEEEALNYFVRFAELEPNINPYISSFFFRDVISFSGGMREEKMLGFLKGLIESGKLNQTVTCHILEVLGDHYKTTNNLKLSKEYYDKIGSVTEWQIAGVFENSSGSGFDKDHGPLQHPQSNSIFTSKYQAEVSWFEMIETYPGKWNNLIYHFDAENSIIYAQTFCNSAIDQDVLFKIGTSGSLKTWVNDKLLFSEPKERNNGMDTYTFTSRLKKGNNRILLQLGSSEISACNFMLRITDNGGINIPNLAFYKTYSDYPTDTTDFQSTSIDYYAETFFVEKIKAEPDNLLNYMLLANTYLGNDKNYLARKTIHEAQKLAPECSFLLTQLIETYLRDENRTELSKVLEQIKELDPNNPMSIMLLMNEAKNNENFEEAHELLEKLISRTGENETTLKNQIQLAASRENYEEFYTLIEKAYKEYPQNEYFVSLKFSLELQVVKDTRKATKIIKTFLKNKYSSEIIYTYASLLFKNGQIDDGFKKLFSPLEYEPNAIGYYNKIASVYFAMRDYKNALKYFEKCLEFAPYIDAYHYSIGQCYAEINQKDKAIQAYQNAIKYYPASYDVRTELRTMQNKKSVFSLFEEPDLEMIYKNSPDAEAYPGSNSLILHDEIQRVAYAEGGTQEKGFMMVKVFTTEGIDYWKEYYIPMSGYQSLTIEKAEVVKKDGSKVAAETSYEYVVFTSLEEGDAISLTYKLDTYKSGRFMKHFVDNYYFDVFIPALTKKYSLLIPPEIKFDYLVTNNAFEPRVSDLDDFKLYEWKKENLDKIDYEEYMPRLVDVETVLHISTIPDWDFISKWYADVTGNKTKSDFILQEKAAELFAGKENLSDLEKARIIYEYTTSKIRYSSVSFRQSGYIPKKASDVISSRIGDCKDVSTLFVALCREVGIDAKYVMVNTRDNGKNESPLPSIVFDHCIAQVTIEGEEYFVELTSEQMPFAALGFNSRFAFALVADDDPAIEGTPIYLDPPTRIKNKVTRNTTVDFDDGKMNVVCNSNKTGTYASKMRERYKNLNAKEQKKHLLSSLSSEYNSVELHALNFYDSLQHPEPDIDYQYSYTIKNQFTRISDLEIFSLPFADKYSYVSFLSTETRKYPLEIWQSFKRCDGYSEELKLEIPEGKQLAEIPGDIEIKNDFGFYSLTFDVADGALVVNRKLEFYPEIISAEDYPEFKEFVNSIIDNDDKKLAFQ